MSRRPLNTSFSLIKILYGIPHVREAHQKSFWIWGFPKWVKHEQVLTIANQNIQHLGRYLINDLFRTTKPFFCCSRCCYLTQLNTTIFMSEIQLNLQCTLLIIPSRLTLCNLLLSNLFQSCALLKFYWSKYNLLIAELFVILLSLWYINSVCLAIVKS